MSKPNPTILFVVGTNYQLYFAYIINHFIKDQFKSSYLLSAAFNPEVNSIAHRLSSFKDVFTIDKNDFKELKSIKNYYNNKTILKSAIDYSKKTSPSILIVFKDNDKINIPIINYCSRRGSKVILVQEGLAVYEEPKNRINTIILLKHFLKKLLFYPDSKGMVQGQNNKINKIAIYEPSYVPKNKIINKNIVQIPNIAPPHNINEAFLKESSLSMKKEYLDNYSILYIGQPLSELNIISEQTENQYIKRIFNIMIDLGFKIVIKPHPAEKNNKYKQVLDFNKDSIIIIDAIYPVETIPCNYNTSFLVTPFSSGAVNISLWYNLPIIFTYKLIVSSILNIDINLLKGSIVNSYIEFSNYLSKYKKNKPNNKYTSNSKLKKDTYLNFVKELLD